MFIGLQDTSRGLRVAPEYLTPRLHTLLFETDPPAWVWTDQTDRHAGSRFQAPQPSGFSSATRTMTSVTGSSCGPAHRDSHS